MPRRNPIGDLKAIGCMVLIVFSVCSGIVSGLKGSCDAPRSHEPYVERPAHDDGPPPTRASAPVEAPPSRPVGFRHVHVYHHASRLAGAMGGATGYEIGAPQAFEVLHEIDGMLEIRTAAGERGWVARQDSEALHASADDVAAIEKLAHPDPEPLHEEAPAPVPYTYSSWPTTGRASERSTHEGTVYVRGYTRKDGTYVRPHTRRR